MGVVVLIIVAVCFLMIVPSKHRDSMAKMRQDWGEYYNYLMYGPESKEEDVTSETWYPLAIENAEPGEMGYEEFYNDYYATLSKALLNKLMLYDDMVTRFGRWLIII